MSDSQKYKYKEHVSTKTTNVVNPITEQFVLFF